MGKSLFCLGSFFLLLLLNIRKLATLHRSGEISSDPQTEPKGEFHLPLTANYRFLEYIILFVPKCDHCFLIHSNLIFLHNTWDFPVCGTVVKNPPANAGDKGLSPGPGRFPHAMEQLSPCATTTEPAL